MRIFIRVVERGSMSAAARDLGIGQPAVSESMDMLLAVCAITASGTPIIVIVLQKKLAKRTFEPDRFTTE